jgi:hypothetical protein
MKRTNQLFLLGLSGIAMFFIAEKYQDYLSSRQPLLLSMAASFIVGVAVVILLDITLSEENNNNKNNNNGIF